MYRDLDLFNDESYHLNFSSYFAHYTGVREFEW